MPELPEVEITCQSLKAPLIHSTFINVLTRREGLRYPFPKYFQEHLLNYKVIHLYRKAKYIIIVLENSFNLIIHLGMSGRLKMLQDPPAVWQKHDHVVFTLQSADFSSFILVYNDPRRFGFMDVIKTEDLPTHRYFKHLGPDPLEDTFTFDILVNRLKNSKKSLKQALLDQRLLVGVGNIYACEALFQARLSPYRLSKDLDFSQYLDLYLALRQILKKAIAQGGASFKDYQHIDGKKGRFQSFFNVYNKHGSPCPRCLTSFLQRHMQQGRSTFCCIICQK